MNILFVLYGDLSTNTANPILLFANELKKLGHDCIVAIPAGKKSSPSKKDTVPVLSFSEILESNGNLFCNGQRADIVHASTPRIIVFNFLKIYFNNWPCPFVMYLEDNEFWIVQNYLGLDDATMMALTDDELNLQVPSALSHPFAYQFFIALADLVLVIQEKLLIEVPKYIPTRVLPWGVDLQEFNPVLTDQSFRDDLKIDPPSKIIVYHGGLNGFTRGAMIDLCRAIEIINDHGVPCKLLRTGPNAINFWDELGPLAKSHIKELGMLDRNDLPKLLASADVYVQPGRINPFEDLRLPSKLLEFFAMGKPVILPNVNIANSIEDGVDAVLLQSGSPEEIANACLNLFQNPEKMTDLGSQARKFAEMHFDINMQTQKLIQAYAEACNTFNLQKSTELWQEVKNKGLYSAALKRIEFDQEGKADQTDFNDQLTKWHKLIELRNKSLHEKIQAYASKHPEAASDPISLLKFIAIKFRFYKHKLKK
jgi:glycosyltransferase involved in cell wall biosynthesis